MLMKFIDVEGVLTRCIVAGDEDAYPVLLIHGQTMTADIWSRNIDVLGRDFRVVAVDMLGHGFTRPPEGKTASIPAKVAHLRALASTLGFKEYAVGGSSYGALLSAHLYFADRERVTKLIINGSGSSFNTEEQLSAYIKKLYAGYKATLTVSTPEMWRERIAYSFYDPASIPQELLTILPLCYAQPWMAACWDDSIRIMMDPAAFRPFRILDRLEEIAVDTLVVWGRQDRGGVYDSAVAAVKRMPKARLLAFDECAHMPMLEKPDAYNAALRDFLRS